MIEKLLTRLFDDCLKQQATPKGWVMALIFLPLQLLCYPINDHYKRCCCSYESREHIIYLLIRSCICFQVFWFLSFFPIYLISVIVYNNIAYAYLEQKIAEEFAHTIRFSLIHYAIILQILPYLIYLPSVIAVLVKVVLKNLTEKADENKKLNAELQANDIEHEYLTHTDSEQ
jgi:hypothetical protein